MFTMDEFYSVHMLKYRHTLKALPRGQDYCNIDFIHPSRDDKNMNIFLASITVVYKKKKLGKK